MISPEELQKAEQIAKNATDFNPNFVCQTNGIRFQHTFNPQFCLSLIEEIRRLKTQIEYYEALANRNCDNAENYSGKAHDYKDKLDRAIEVIKQYENTPIKTKIPQKFLGDVEIIAPDFLSEFEYNYLAREFLKSIEKGSE